MEATKSSPSLLEQSTVPCCYIVETRPDGVVLTPVAVLKGTVNDATDFPTPSKSHGSYHWAFERLLSASLIPVMGAAAVSSGSAYVSLLPHTAHPRPYADMTEQTRTRTDIF